MRLIAITSEKFLYKEADYISLLLTSGVETLHLRKPHATIRETAHLLDQIPPDLHSSIVIHDHFSLTDDYRLKGIHLNSRHPQAPQPFAGSISRSCHSIDELDKAPLLNYQFLSPIFNSISKNGYQSAFTHQELIRASAENRINNKVIALGGIDPDRISDIRRYAFGGIAVLGYLWQEPDFGRLEKRVIRLVSLLQ